jgi:hypothetical protein
MRAGAQRCGVERYHGALPLPVSAQLVTQHW